jgi:hypothetical protein
MTLETSRREWIYSCAKAGCASRPDAIGVFLVLLPIGSAFGGDNEGVVAQYKGEVLALERAMGMNCRG